MKNLLIGKTGSKETAMGIKVNSPTAIKDALSNHPLHDEYLLVTEAPETIPDLQRQAREYQLTYPDGSKEPYPITLQTKRKGAQCGRNCYQGFHPTKNDEAPESPPSGAPKTHR